MTQNSFYKQNHPMQAEFDSLTDLIPAEGESDIPHIEAIRIVNRLYYEFTNNGNENAYICSTDDWNEYGEIESNDDASIDEFYQDILDKLRQLVPDADNEISAVENLILQGEFGYRYNDEEILVYESLVEKVLNWALCQK